MRPLMIVLVALALGIAGVTAFLARNFLGKPEPAPQQVIAQPVGQRVLVAAREISAGNILVEEDLRFEHWPSTSVDKRFIVFQAGGEDPKAKVIGSVAARRILAGEPLSGTSVFRQDEAGQMSGMLGPGMRAVSIAVSNTSAVSGFVTPGDRVDVVALMKFKDRADNGGKPAEDELYVTETVLGDLRVLAVDQNLKTGQVALPGKTVTLEVPPKDAEKLILAGASATLNLVLRSQTTAGALDDPALYHNVAALKAMQKYSDIAAKVMGGAGAKADPSIEAVAGRNVKVNRAGLIDVRTFPD